MRSFNKSWLSLYNNFRRRLSLWWNCTKQRHHELRYESNNLFCLVQTLISRDKKVLFKQNDINDLSNWYALWCFISNKMCLIVQLSIWLKYGHTTNSAPTEFWTVTIVRRCSTKIFSPSTKFVITGHTRFTKLCTN